MLRHHCGWAWRSLIAFLFLFFIHGPAVRGAPLVGLPPIKVVIPGKPQPPSSYAISGYVYDDAADLGVRLSGDAGLPAVQMTLLQYSSTAGALALTGSFSGFSNSAGYYAFGNLTAGDVYTIEETQPANFTTTADTVGYFSGSGGTLAAPPGASNGTLSPPNGISGITFAPSSTGIYTAVNYNFGESPNDFPVYGVPGKPVIPGGGKLGPSASFSTSLSLAGTSDRFLAGTGAGSLSLVGAVTNTGSSGSGDLNWSISGQSVGLAMTPTSGADLAPGASQDLTGTVSGTNLTSGTQNATLTLAGRVGTSGQLTTNTASVLIDPVFSRGIDAVTTANLGRIMAGASTLPQSLTISSTGAYLDYNNLTMNSGTVNVPADSHGNAFSFVNGTAVTYNGTTTSNSAANGFSATFSSSASGPVSGTAAVAGSTGLFTAETLASGTPTLPTLDVPYTATVLQQRQVSGGPAFTLPSAAGGFLYGATVPAPSGYTVLSSSDSNHVTSVYVTGSANAVWTGDGATTVGQVTAGQTLVNSAGTTTVPVQILLEGLGPYSGSASLSVVTAESASVKDPGNYAPVGLTFNVTNVGYAATGGSAQSGGAVIQTFGAPLSAPVSAGARLATFSTDASRNFTGVPLTSIVASAGNAGANSTTTGYNGTTRLDPTNPVNDPTGTGTVGSQCDILDSTMLSTSASITMAWRSRNTVENGSMTQSSTEQLPPGVQWLTSDVVGIAGVPQGTTYALEMSFDDSINVLLDHPAGRPTTIAGSYLAEMVTAGSVSTWVNAALVSTAGSLAQSGVADSLTDFLANEYAAHSQMTHDEVLAALAGSWGVSLPATPGGKGTSWAIVNNGGGDFAVVPEPSTFALLGAGIAGLFVYRARRKLRTATPRPGAGPGQGRTIHSN